MLKKTDNKNKGITLIALVITIIVLLILAGVSISMLAGDNNILKRAGEAKDKTELESIKEEAKIVMSNRILEKTTMRNNSKTLKEDLQSGISGGEVEEITKADGTTKYTDVYYVSKNGQTITVYEDGEVVEGKVSIWKGATDIECPKFEKDANNVWNWYIYTAGQLKFLADFVNNGDGTTLPEGLTNYVTQAGYDPSTVTMSTDTTIYLMNNLDLGARQGAGTTDEEKWATNLDSLKWMPIGINYNNVQNKLGTFEGNNYSICGVYVNREENFDGIFGNSNTIQNLTIKNSYIKGKNYTGGIVGSLASGMIKKCNNINTTINAKEIGGGIVGFALGTIDNCTNTGKIIGKNTSENLSIGGISGSAWSSNDITINDCVNSGEINGKGSKVGGIIGRSQAHVRILQCTNNGKVIGKNNTGGIAGESIEKIEKCINNGEVIGEETVGGIVAIIYNNTETCINKGRVIGFHDVGGIIGSNNITGSIVGNIIACKNSGVIEGEMTVGGIVGYIGYGEKVEACSNTGLVIGKEGIGGIVGQICTDKQDPSDKEQAIVRKCYNSGKIQGVNHTGGVIGTAAQYNSLVEKCYNLGEVNGTEDITGGIVGDLGRSSRVYNCYNMNKVIGADRVGGVVGRSYNSTCEIKNCYNTGKISGTSNLGGILGLNSNSSTIANSYYLEGTATLDVGSDSANSLAKTKEYITQDFVTTANATETIWKVEAGKNDGWPILNE